MSDRVDTEAPAGSFMTMDENQNVESLQQEPVTVTESPTFTPSDAEAAAAARRRTVAGGSHTVAFDAPDPTATRPSSAQQRGEENYGAGEQSVFVDMAKMKPIPTPHKDYDDVNLYRDEDDEEEEDASSLDSYGLPSYKPRFPDLPSSGQGDLSVPWNLRRPEAKSSHCTFFDFLRQQQFWTQFEFSTRITAIAVLVPSALIAAKLPNSPFVSAFMPMSASVLAAKGNVGEAIAYLFTWTRAGCMWLPLSVIAGALHLGEHLAGWCIYYTFILILMAVFTDGMVRRIVLLLFNSCLVGMLVDPSRGPLYPCRVMVDWCIGTALCTVAAFFPYPIFCKRRAQRLLDDIARNAGTAFRGLVYSFWSPSNVERNMAMSKVRMMTESLDSFFPAFEHSQSFAFYEFLFESTEVRELRDVKIRFFESLRVNLSSMTRVLDMVEASPSAIDDSDRSKAFGELLTPHLNNVAEAFDELLNDLVAAKTRKALLDLKPNFDNLTNRCTELQDAYALGRRMLFYEHTSSTLEEFVPLMTFYLFTIISCHDTVNVFQMQVLKYKPSAVGTLKQIFRKTAIAQFEDNVNFVHTLFKTWDRREVQRVIEAVKVSGAMIATIGFTYLINVPKASFSGPNIIAFVSGMNPVEAVQASIVRLTGCLIGTVLGFFAGTYSDTAVQRVASLCTLMFVGTFFRNDKEYGIMSVYAMFVLIPLDSILPTTVDDTVARMNQNTFGIFIYLFISIVVLPLSPSAILRAKRRNVLRRMSNVLTGLVDLFTTPLSTEVGGNSSLPRGSMTSPKLTAAPAPRAAPPALTDAVTVEAKGKAPISLPNRSFHQMKGVDHSIDNINEMLNDVIKRLRGTKEFMAFAKDERGLVEIDYPIKSCNSTYLHMYHMTFLLKTMLMSWTVLRSQRHYTPDTKHMLRNLQPVGNDAARAFTRFTDLMCYMMQDPTVNLEGELMKAVLELISAAKELHRRKSQIMLMLINSSVHEYRCAVAASSGKHIATVGASVMSDRAGVGSPATRSEPGLRELYDVARSQPVGRGLPRAATHDSLAMSTGGERHTTSPSMLRDGNFRLVNSDRNVSVIPYLRRLPTQNDISVDEGPLRLPSDFVFPMTSEDAEGLHSFSLCLEMFANETKLLMMSLGAMLDLLRAKQ